MTDNCYRGFDIAFKLAKKKAFMLAEKIGTMDYVDSEKIIDQCNSIRKDLNVVFDQVESRGDIDTKEKEDILKMLLRIQVFLFDSQWRCLPFELKE